MLSKVIVASVLAFSSINTYAQITADQALSQLSAEAVNKAKAGGISLSKLVSNASNDLIVEYNVAEGSALNSQFPSRLSIHASIKSRVKGKHATGNLTLRDYYALPITFNRISDRTTLVQLLNDPEVKAVYPNLTLTSTLAQSLPLIKQPQAAAAGFNGNGSSIAVLDTGVNYTHADFGCTAPGIPSTCKVAYAADFATDDSSLDDNGHGSNVSGIASGVAPGAKILGLDVFDGAGAYESDIIAALNWVLNNATTYDIKAANMSLGVNGSEYSTVCSSPFTTIFSQLRTANIAPVLSAGNSAKINGVGYPACTAGSIVVGAVYDANLGGLAWSNCTDYSTSADQVACFSNSGDLVTLFAPGALIDAAGYSMGGTSQAAPHVAGAIAVLRASGTGAAEPLDDTIQRLEATGTPVTDAKSGLTRPRIDLYAAVSSLSDTSLSWLSTFISYVIG